MARINLLPWREELRKQRQREFGVMIVVGLLIFVGIAAYAHFFIEDMMENQGRRNATLQREIDALDLKIIEIRNLEKKKADLLARMNIIQTLQQSRPQIVHLFDEIARTAPEGVFLTSLRQKGAKLDMQGQAQSNARVSSYMRKIDQSGWIGHPQLQSIITKGKGKDGGHNRFKLNAVQQVKKPAGANEEKKS